MEHREYNLYKTWSASRLRHVQDFLKPGSSSGADAILCVQGVDSRYNDGCRELISYLLFGFYELRKAEIEKSGFEEELIDDLMVLIQRDSVHVYCNPVLYLYLLPYISHWRNLRLHCLRDNEFDCYEGSDAAEEFKVQSFVSMVSGCHTVGIPYSSRPTAHLHPFDKMAVEKWPIVQAFALEGLGGRGFFTMKYKVVDVSEEIEKLYSIMDPVSLEAIITEQLPLFERQWNTMMTSLNVDMSSDHSKNFTEEKVGEPFQTYFSHGQANSVTKTTSVRNPFVLFGDHSCKKHLERSQRGENSNVTSQEDWPKSNNSVQLMVCQSVAPNGPLCCARTYSLAGLHSPYTAAVDGQGDVGVAASVDAQHVHELYSAVIDSVAEAIEMYTNTLSVAQAQDKAFSAFSKRCSTIKDSKLKQYIQKSGNLSFSLTAFNCHGEAQPLSDGVSCPLVKTVCMSLYDVPSLERPAKSLGSLVFADSFLDSTIPVRNQDGSERMDGQHLVLTGEIPRLVTWTAGQSTKDAAQHVLLKNQFGKLLTAEETIHALAPNSLCNSPLEGKITVWESCILFSHTQLGELYLTKDHVTSLSLYDGDSSSVVAVLMVEYIPDFRPHIPPQLLSHDNTLLLAFFPRSKAYKKLYSNVLPGWKEGSDLPGVETLPDLPEKHTNIYSQLQRLLSVHNMDIRTILTPMKKAAAAFRSLAKFMEHLSVSSAGRVHISERDLPVLLNQSVDFGKFDNSDEIVISIVSGLPGSHKENLCHILTNLAKEQNRWIVFKQPLDNANPFSAKSLQQSLTSTLGVVRKRRATSGNRHVSVLILTPGYADVVDVVQAIISHPDPAINRSYKIGAITCCIDPLNAYMEHRMTFPVLLNHCALGWVNNIIFTSSTAPQTAMLTEMQELVRCLNDDVALLLADKGELSRSTDIDLVLSRTAFSENSMVQARHLLTPGWSSGQFHSASAAPCMQETIIRFSQPLDKSKLVNELRGLKTSQASYPYAGNMYHLRGRTSFLDSLQSFELHYTVQSGSLSLYPVDVAGGSDAPTVNFVVFSGCDLQEETLKNWLRTVAPQKPEKKKYIDRKGLTKDVLKTIHERNHLNALPAGWFYNGHQFISLTGDKSDTHPDLEQFILAYIEEMNKEIKDYNTTVDENNFNDLFA